MEKNIKNLKKNLPKSNYEANDKKINIIDQKVDNINNFEN